jgi:hypothetical protein
MAAIYAAILRGMVIISSCCANNSRATAAILFSSQA